MGQQRVLRGGSWLGRPENLRSAYRGWGYAGYRLLNLGFRLAQDVVEPDWRVLRGGSWYGNPKNSCLADRIKINSLTRFYHTGFRLAQTLDAIGDNEDDN